MDTTPTAPTDTTVDVQATTTEETVIDKIPLSNTGATELLSMMNGQTGNNTLWRLCSGFGGGFGNSGFRRLGWMGGASVAALATVVSTAALAAAVAGGGYGGMAAATAATAAAMAAATAALAAGYGGSYGRSF